MSEKQPDETVEYQGWRVSARALRDAFSRPERQPRKRISFDERKLLDLLQRRRDAFKSVNAIAAERLDLHQRAREIERDLARLREARPPSRAAKHELSVSIQEHEAELKRVREHIGGLNERHDEAAARAKALAPVAERCEKFAREELNWTPPGHVR